MKSYKIIPEKNLVIYRPSGILTAMDIIEYIQNIVKDDSFKDGLFEYIDLSIVDEWKLDHLDVEKVTYFDSDGMETTKKIAKSAIYAPSDIAFGMARMYQNFAEKYNSNIFISRDESEALSYLDLQMNDVKF